MRQLVLLIENYEDDAKREDCTILVSSIPLHATENDLYAWFKEVR